MSEIKQTLQEYWGYPDFRPLQEDIIHSVLEGKDTLALMPTGGGKSLCYQLPAVHQEGICLVISPLIALMKDQVQQLREKQIPASAIFSGIGKREIDITLDNCIYGKEKLLYVSPERLTTKLFQARLKKMEVNLLAVDEAHCISQWGYDFRPAYLQIAEIREFIPEAPVLALTASATPDVQTDIQEKLEFEEENLLQKSFARENLSYVASYEEDKHRKLLKILENVKGTGIIYVRSRRKTKEIAQFLRKNEIWADFYHAGLSSQKRHQKQEQWMNNRTRMMVCTNAFGMGIDKPDVRTVIHWDLPDSLEAYYQEAGRAGRDGRQSFAVLLYDQPDLEKLEQRIEWKFVALQTIKDVYHALGNYYQLAIGAGEGQTFDFDMLDFIDKFDFQPLEVHNALKFLERDNWVALTDVSFMQSRVKVQVNHEELYRFQIANRSVDPLIKVLLRSYGGLFDHYVSIREDQLARRIDADSEEVREALRFLAENEMVDYQEQKDVPQLTFVNARVAKEDLTIDRELLQERKKIYRQKVQAVIHYAENDLQCRSQQILKYFGEYNSEKCGICDVCLGRKKVEVETDEFESLKSTIHMKLSKEPRSVHALTQQLSGYEDEKVLEAVRWLMDNQKIALNEDQQLEWQQ